MTKTNTTTLTADQATTLESDAKNLNVDGNTLINAVQYFKHDRKVYGLDALNRLVFVGQIAHKLFKADKKTYADNLNAIFLNSLSDDDINYSIRIAGFVKSARAKVIDTAHLIKWYKDNNHTIVSAKNIVNTYNADHSKVTETDEKTEYSFDKVMEALDVYVKRAEAVDNAFTTEQVEQLKEKVSGHKSDFLDQWVLIVEEAAKKAA